MRVPDAEVGIDADLVRALLAEQHPDLAELPLRYAAEGWDVVMWRIGDRLAARLPRRAFGAGCLETEHRWLPELAPRVATAVPEPLRLGEPGCGYPWPWTVVAWLPGATLDERRLAPAGVRALGWALHTLHVPAPDGAPVSAARGIPLGERESPLARLAALYDGAPPAALRRIWDRALAAEAAMPALRRLWIHGDVHARNLLAGSDGDLAAILDWGDVGSGDPAVDLSAMWTVLEPTDHAAFCAGYGPVDGPLLARARGWALVFGVIFASLENDPGAVALGRMTLARLQG